MLAPGAAHSRGATRAHTRRQGVRLRARKRQAQKTPVVWGAAPKKSTKNAICATFRRRIVNDSRSLYRARRASYISIFSPPTIRRKTVFCTREFPPWRTPIRGILERARVAYIFGVGRETHTLAPEQKITIAFLTEKDGQMAEKRRKKRQPFCLAHLRRG